jgi:putative lipoic acid-binding regulatory protein
MIDLSKHKLELTYPCHWEYKLITYSKQDALQSVKEVVLEREFTLEVSKVSKKGKYKSFTLKTMVHNEDDRVTIYELLKQHELIKMIL